MNEIVKELRKMTGRLQTELHELRSLVWQLEGELKRREEEIAKLKELAAATGPEAIRAALAHWTPEELAKAGIV